MENKVKAQAKYVKGSPIKARLVADAVRGMDASAALVQLKYMQKKAAHDVYKVVASAVANATHNNKMDASKLFISSIMIDEAPTFKRFRPESKGRARRILKRNCHITVYVEEKAAVVADTKSVKAEKPATKKSETKAEAKPATKKPATKKAAVKKESAAPKKTSTKKAADSKKK